MKQLLSSLSLPRLPPLAEKLALGALLAGLAAFPFLADNYIIHIGILCLIYSALALSLNIIIGLSGQFSLGHVTFYGMGAYVCALLMMRAGLNFWLALLGAAVFCGIFGFLLALPTLKLRGDYVAVVTLGFGEVFRMFLMNAESLTYGTRGIPSIPVPSILGFAINSKIRFYFMFLIILIAIVIFVRRMLNSGFGIAIMTINDDPIAASAIGIFPTKYKLVSFVIGAVIAGVMGGLFAVYTRFIGPTNFAYSESILMVAMVVLGGLGSIPGSILGATLLTILPEALRSMSQYRMIIYGLAMVVVMIFRPHGIWGMDKRKKNAYLQNL